MRIVSLKRVASRPGNVPREVYRLTFDRRIEEASLPLLRRETFPERVSVNDGSIGLPLPRGS